MTLPTGGKVKKGRTGGVRVEWAGFSFIASFELDRDRLAPVRSAVAPDAFGTYEGTIAVTVAGVGYTCTARGEARADAEKLMAKCDALAAASPKGQASAAPPASAAAAALELEPRSFTVKAPLAKPVKITARVPKGWSTSESLGTTLLKDPSPLSPNAISATFSAFDGLKSVADAEREAKRLDAAGLDTIDQKRELSPGKFLVSTAPRGLLKLTTVRVFVRGKKGSAVATCSGVLGRRDDLERICSSIDAE